MERLRKKKTISQLQKKMYYFVHVPSTQLKNSSNQNCSDLIWVQNPLIGFLTRDFSLNIPKKYCESELKNKIRVEFFLFITVVSINYKFIDLLRIIFIFFVIAWVKVQKIRLWASFLVKNFELRSFFVSSFLSKFHTKKKQNNLQSEENINFLQLFQHCLGYLLILLWKVDIAKNYTSLIPFQSAPYEPNTLLLWTRSWDFDSWSAFLISSSSISEILPLDVWIQSFKVDFSILFLKSSIKVRNSRGVTL